MRIPAELHSADMIGRSLFSHECCHFPGVTGQDRKMDAILLNPLFLVAVIAVVTDSRSSRLAASTNGDPSMQRHRMSLLQHRADA